jgi:hypothetical protein
MASHISIAELIRLGRVAAAISRRGLAGIELIIETLQLDELDAQIMRNEALKILFPEAFR